VTSARDRFKGALQDLLHHSEEDSDRDTSDEEVERHWQNRFFVYFLLF
jgi:hypothetical protein